LKEVSVKVKQKVGESSTQPKPMISVEQATELIFSKQLRIKTERVNLPEATGRILGRDVFADRHFPPFDRVTMDGVAIRFEAWEAGQRSFSVEGVQMAGEVEKTLAEGGACIEVMTGAVLPGFCDTVIPYEEVEIKDGKATIKSSAIKKGQNIHRQGSDQKNGALLLEKGTLIGSAEIAVMATVGVSIPYVYCLPVVSIVSTGDELVPVSQVPEPYQIRSSNSHALAAALIRWGIVADIHHIKDDKTTLKKELSAILKKSDVILLSGGVSKGKADYLPEVLAEAGVSKVFHGVAQKPGKPFWFGQMEDKKFVFAFPGNPVSTFMCFHRYFVPWLASCFGLMKETKYARLAADFEFASSLTYFLQVKATINDSGEIWAQPKSGGGSGDLANLLFANGFLELPPRSSAFLTGEVFPLFVYKPL